MDHFGLFADQSIVALIAEGLTSREEEFGMVAGVGGVAGGAAVVGDNRMDTLHPLGGIIVTTGAELTPFGAEKFALFTQVRIMATGAAVIKSGMDHLFAFAHAVMALLAQCGTVCGQLESALFAGVRKAACFMTG